jgi:hypothetical protein
MNPNRCDYYEAEREVSALSSCLFVGLNWPSPSVGGRAPRAAVLAALFSIIVVMMVVVIITAIVVMVMMVILN